jgi:hypothetical protein
MKYAVEIRGKTKAYAMGFANELKMDAQYQQENGIRKALGMLDVTGTINHDDTFNPVRCSDTGEVAVAEHIRHMMWNYKGQRDGIVVLIRKNHYVGLFTSGRSIFIPEWAGTDIRQLWREGQFASGVDFESEISKELDWAIRKASSQDEILKKFESLVKEYAEDSLENSGNFLCCLISKAE